MRVVINAECSIVPERAKILTSEGSALLNFLSCLGYDPSDPPLADLLRQYHNLDGDWLVLTPVHWQATHNDAMIIALGDDLQLQETEIKLWFNLLAQYLAEEDKPLYYHDAQTWLLRNDKHLSINARPAPKLVNKSLMPELAQIDATMYWQKFITESQMFFASKPNQSAINGVWPWGGATLKDKKVISICADEFFLSMAQLCGSNVTLYSPSIKLKDYQLLLITEFSSLSEHHQHELNNIYVHWYWNNIAYSNNQSNWFIRLWRKLIHAH